MRTSAIRWPSTSKRRAESGARSSRAHSRTASPTTVFQFVDHSAAQSARERADRKTVEHVIEEAEHDEAFCLFGLDAARLQVVTLFLVDRTNRGCVRAPHVVRLDLEIGNRFGARA